MTEGYSAQMQLRTGELAVYSDAQCAEGGRVIVGVVPFALVLDALDALALAAHIDRAARALLPDAPR